MLMKSNKPPIVIFFFRREHVIEVIKQVKLYQPSKLYLVSDGGRNANEHNTCVSIRGKVESLIDWNCEIIKIYKDYNHGVDVIIPQSISEIFKNEEKLIILEDDIVADLSFFIYAKELLESYKDNECVMNICGTNWFDEKNFTNNDYLYVHTFDTCGWATWKRAWQKYNHTMDNFLNGDVKQKLKAVYNDIFYELGCYRLFNDHYIKIQEKDWKNSHWDGKWFYSCIMNDGLSVIPAKNLVTNIGFDESATHTTNSNSFQANKKRGSLDFPLKYSSTINAIFEYDKLYAKKILNFSNVNQLKTSIKKIVNKLKKTLRRE